MAIVTTMPADMRVAIQEAVAGKPGVMGFLKNFNNAIDGANETGAAKATKMYAGRKTGSNADTESMDLAGSLVGVDGEACVFTKVHAIYVKADAPVAVGGAASNAFTGPFANASDIVNVAAGETFLVTNDAGWTVTAGTGDILKFALAADGAFDVIIIGE